MKKLNYQVPDFQITELFPKRTMYCVCIPVINEGNRLKNQLLKMKKTDFLADILVADGGSTDGSVDIDVLESLGVRSLLVKKGPGKLSAQLRMGFYYALVQQGYQGVITIDGNNKDGVEAIPGFIKRLDEGYDFIQGSRFLPGGLAINTPITRLMPMKLIHIPLTCCMAGFRYTDTTNGFRAHSRRLLLDSEIQIFRNIFDTYELLLYLSVKAPIKGYNVTEIPVTRTYPKDSKTPTKISPLKGNIKIMQILMEMMIHKYDPKEEI